MRRPYWFNRGVLFIALNLKRVTAGDTRLDLQVAAHGQRCSAWLPNGILELLDPDRKVLSVVGDVEDVTDRP
jgi:hypothetical protein